MAVEMGFCTVGGQTSRMHKGACKAVGGSFSTNGDAGVSSEDGFDVRKFVKENPLEAASYAAMGIPVAGWGVAAAGVGIKGLSALYKGGKMSGKLGGLMDKMFRTSKNIKSKGTGKTPKGEPLPKYSGGKPVLDKKGNPAFLTERKFSAPKAAGIGGGLGYLGTQTGVLPSASYDANIAAQQQVTADAQSVKDAEAAEAQAKLDAIQAEKDRVAGLDMFGRMKEPGYWSKSISGMEGDNRLTRIGQLMAYHGLPPSKRGTDPAKLFAEQAATAGALRQDQLNAFAKAQSDSGVGKQTFKDAVDQITPRVSEAMDSGFSGYFGDPAGEEVTAEAGAIVKKARERSESKGTNFSDELEAVLAAAGY